MRPTSMVPFSPEEVVNTKSKVGYALERSARRPL
jgi:hypothetical protein